MFKKGVCFAGSLWAAKGLVLHTKLPSKTLKLFNDEVALPQWVATKTQTSLDNLTQAVESY